MKAFYTSKTAAGLLVTFGALGLGATALYLSPDSTVKIPMLVDISSEKPKADVNRTKAGRDINNDSDVSSRVSDSEAGRDINNTTRKNPPH